ncbi:MAG TPA: glycosyltransferase [Chloroflexota bacterium]|nr:glycosyltransferase [Chloroflexota bacterium]
MIALSVIIPTYNKADYLDLTLASYEHQTFADYELVVVDDGSTDDTKAVVERHARNLNIVYQYQANSGRSMARNTAIGRASGRVLVFSDDDRMVAPDFLAEHARSNEDDGVQVLGAQQGILSFWRPDLPISATYLSNLIARCPELADARSRRLVTADDLRERFGDTLARWRMPEYWWDGFCAPILRRYSEKLVDLSVPWVLGTTSNLSAPRQRVLEVGAFDVGFRGWGLEDLDLCYRLHHAGSKTVINESAINYHQVHPTAHEATARHAQWTRNLLYMLNKYDALDMALYGYVFTRPEWADVGRLNDWLRELAPAGAVLRRELQRAYQDLVRIRIQSFIGSCSVRIPGEW